MDLTAWDVILVNTSAGKDSQVTLDEVCRLAREQGVMDRVQAVHCDLGRVEWQGTRELAERQCAAYGVPLTVVSRPQGDLLDQVRARRMWPSSTARYCTSDQKRGQVDRVITALVRARYHGKAVRVLSCMGLRKAESPARSKLPALVRNERASNGRREVWTWLPIHELSTEEVWARIRASGVEHHGAYDLGMPRLSCVFCVFASKPALMLAGQHNRELLAQYVAVEAEIGHTFRKDLPIREVQEAIERGEQPGPITTWEM